jgi:DNA-directed RNA polymerase specialized sigma24 family protein
VDNRFSQGLPMNLFALHPTCSETISSAAQQDAGVNWISSAEADTRFKSVVLPHLTDAHVLARWLTANCADAEDVVQDACLRAFRGIGNFSNGNARAWVLTIVRRTAYDSVQNTWAATLLPVDELEGVKGAPSGELDAPATALIAKAEAALLRATIAALPPPFRRPW